MPLYSSYKIYTRKQRELWKNMEDEISIILEILLKRISSLKLYLYLFDRTTRISESISLHTKTIILSNILNNNLYTQKSFCLTYFASRNPNQSLSNKIEVKFNLTSRSSLAHIGHSNYCIIKFLGSLFRKSRLCVYCSTLKWLFAFQKLFVRFLSLFFSSFSFLRNWTINFNTIWREIQWFSLRTCKANRDIYYIHTHIYEQFRIFKLRHQMSSKSSSNI